MGRLPRCDRVTTVAHACFRLFPALFTPASLPQISRCTASRHIFSSDLNFSCSSLALPRFSAWRTVEFSSWPAEESMLTDPSPPSGEVDPTSGRQAQTGLCVSDHRCARATRVANSGERRGNGPVAYRDRRSGDCVLQRQMRSPRNPVYNCKPRADSVP
jgi:hypothetical protein